MLNKHDQEFDPSRPALVLIFGDTNKKHRLLDRDVIVIGRARGCDLGLDAPDISSIHCLISRGPGGYHVRDCQSRAGTKLNGNTLRESPLRDGDLLQIGPFSFRAHLPGTIGKGVNSRRTGLEHLQHSRRNLARIALRQRKLLLLPEALGLSGGGRNSKGQLSKQLATLKARVRDYDQRVRGLEDAERELVKDRESFDRATAAFRLQVQQQELEFAKKEQVDDTEKSKTLEEQSLKIEQRQRELDVQTYQLQFREQQLQAREKPLEAQQQQLQSLNEEIARKDHNLSQKLETFARDQKEFSMKRDQWAHDQTSILTRIGQQKSALAQAEDTLQQQRKDLDELLSVLQSGQLSTAGPSADSAELQELQAENIELRKMLEEQMESTQPTGDKLRRLQVENEELRSQLEEVLTRPDQGDSSAAADLSKEIELLRKTIEEKDAELTTFRAKSAHEPIKDIDSYEAELNEFRRQLEGDRGKLNKEIEHLRAKNKELDEATRELELEMLRERAEMAREKQRLDRMREDVRQDVERMQRDSGIRDRLAPVQNLREHINRR